MGTAENFETAKLLHQTVPNPHTKPTFSENQLIKKELKTNSVNKTTSTTSSYQSDEPINKVNKGKESIKSSEVPERKSFLDNSRQIMDSPNLTGHFLIANLWVEAEKS